MFLKREGGGASSLVIFLLIVPFDIACSTASFRSCLYDLITGHDELTEVRFPLHCAHLLDSIEHMCLTPSVKGVKHFLHRMGDLHWLRTFPNCQHAVQQVSLYVRRGRWRCGLEMTENATAAGIHFMISRLAKSVLRSSGR